MKNKTHLDSLLKLKANETEKELLNDYPMETVLPLAQVSRPVTLRYSILTYNR